MTTGTVAAVDLGATSGRVIVGRVGPDTLDTETVARFPNTPVATPDGLHWNITGLYGSVTAGLREAFRRAPETASIGIDAWAVDYAMLRNGRMLGEPFHYRDTRTDRGVPTVHSRVPFPKLYDITGLQFLPFNTLYQFAAEPRDILDFADQVLLIPDLIAYWLTGQARAELTNASTTGLLRDSRWNDDLLDRLGFPRRLLAPLVAPGEDVGLLSPRLAADLGANPLTPVIAVGSHDTASAVAAIPLRPEHAAYVSCGTWGLVGVEIPAPIRDERARAARFTNEGGVDGSVRLLRNVMGLWILSETVRGWEREGHTIDLTALVDAAADLDVPTAVFDPDDARFLPPGDMPARIDAWCAEHGVASPRTRPEYARSIIESLAQAFAATVRDAAELSGIRVDTIHIVGGGALNSLLCQRTADRAGLPVAAGPVEATALGNILVQARANGFITGSLEDLRDLVARTHTPVVYSPRL